MRSSSAVANTKHPLNIEDYSQAYMYGPARLRLYAQSGPDANTIRAQRSHDDDRF